MAAAFVKNVGSASVSMAETSSLTIPAAGVAEGNFLVVRVMVSDSGAITVSDSGSNTYVKHIDAVENSVGGGEWHTVAVSKITTALTSGQSITLTWPTMAMADGAWVVDEFSGVASTTLDTSASQGQAATSTPSSGTSGTPTSVGLVYGAVAGDSDMTISSQDGDTAGGSAWTGLTRAVSAGRWTAGAYKITTSTATQNYGVTLSGSANCHTAVLLFAEEASGDTVSPALISQTASLFAPQINQAVDVGLISVTGQVYAPSVAQLVSPGVITQTAQVFAPQVDLAISLGLIDQTATIFAPSVAQLVSSALISQTATLYAPQVDQALAPGLISQTGQTYAPTVIPDQTVSVGLIDSSAVIYAPSIASLIAVGLIDSTGQVFAPQVDQLVALGLIDSTAQIYAPTLGAFVSPGVIASTGVVYAPTVIPDQTISVGVIDQTGTVYAPSIAQAAALGLITSTGQTYAPTVSLTVEPGLITQAAQVYAPTVSVAGAEAPEVPSGSGWRRRRPQQQPVRPEGQRVEMPTIRTQAGLFGPRVDAFDADDFFDIDDSLWN